jgi:putative MATE family efflux protein
LQKYTERLGSAPIGRLLVSLSLPGIAASLTTSLYNIVDTFWVARLGHEAIAALTIVFPYQILIFAVAGGTGIGISALVSRSFGEKDLETTNHAAGQVFFLSLFWGILFMAASFFFSEPILRAIGATPDIMEYSSQYLVIISFGATQIIFATMTSNLIRGSGDAIKPMIIMITACIINFILEPFMVLGLGPFPEMGVRGAALATVIAQSCGALLSLYYFLARKTAFHIEFKHLKPDVHILRGIYRVGASAMTLQITESLSFVLFNKVVASYGSIYIAALGMAMRISDLAYMPIMGLSNGLLPIVGFNFGNRNFKRLWQSVKLAVVGIVSLLVIITAAIEVLAPQIIGIFNSDPKLLAATVPAMRIMLSTLVFIGPTLLFITTFQGLSRGMLALILSLVRQFFFFIPLMFLLSYILGINGVWISMPASDILGFLISLLFVFREYTKQPKNGVPSASL